MPICLTDKCPFLALRITPPAAAAILVIVAGLLGVVPGLSAQERISAQGPTQQRAAPQRPADDDYTAASLRRYIGQMQEYYGGDDRNVALQDKAELFEWVLWRYHHLPYGPVQNKVELPEQRGRLPVPRIGSDTSTWNGALLAALSYKYAVTRDPETLQRIVALLDGLRFFTTVTGRPGCYARSIVPAGTSIRQHEAKKFGVFRYMAPGGRTYDYLGSPAKGTYNQLAGGYAAMMMLVYDDLPVDVQRQARADVTALVWHVLSDDYHIIGPDGTRTPYGDLTPIVASVGVPFNGQVAYQIVALGHYFPGDSPDISRAIAGQYDRLREKRHAYYMDPRKSPVRPQRIGDHPLVKGMNDRSHVMGSAYVGLALELDRCRRTDRTPNRTFMYRLGRTMYWTMREIGHQRNALCNFMWAGMLNDPARMDMIVHRREQTAVSRQIDRGLADGVEQLRRFSLDRFHRTGRYVETKTLHWVDQQMLDDYIWKSNPKARWEVTGDVTNLSVAAIDYLAAYWLMRYHELQNHPAVAQHHTVL